MNSIDLAGRKAVVTGAARGIGLAIVERFLAAKAEVSLWDADAHALDAASKRLAGQGTIYNAVVDVTDAAAVASAANAAIGQMGGVDILVNNAGITGPNRTTWEYTPEDWRKVVDVDLTGPFLCCRAVVPHMLSARYGRIINIASIAGKEGNPNAARLLRRQGRRDRPHQVAGQGAGDQQTSPSIASRPRPSRPTSSSR